MFLQNIKTNLYQYFGRTQIIRIVIPARFAIRHRNVPVGIEYIGIIQPYFRFIPFIADSDIPERDIPVAFHDGIVAKILICEMYV